MTDRASRLSSLFHGVVRGERPLNAQQKDIFLEAICAQPEPAVCINKILGSQNGLSSLQAAVRFDLTVQFFNGLAMKLLKYIQAPEVSAINGGQFLHRVLIAIVEPPIFWTPFSQAFQLGTLTSDAQQCCAWIIHQLISLPGFDDAPYRRVVEHPGVLDGLLNSQQLELRSIGQKIKSILSSSSTLSVPSGALGPGGRHDNDLADFRQISIIPTNDEIKCLEPAFLRSSAIFEDPANVDDRVKIYRDHEFRLLREDMVAEMREELQVALGEKKGKHRGLVLELELQDIQCDVENRSKDKWCLVFKCKTDLPQYARVKPNKRLAFIKENKKLLMHQSLACLISGKEILGFVIVSRDEDLLAKNPPVLLLQPQGPIEVIQNLLLGLKSVPIVSLIQINTAVFAFEPILKSLQGMKTLPLREEILFWDINSTMTPPSSMARAIISSIQANPRADLKPLLNTTNSIHLDASQAKSLLAGLTQRVALIQGPPGTGKSFIGALLAKVIHDSTDQNILVVCYTNHALDQFLEDLMKIGIPAGSMVRLGGKSTSATEHLSLFKQKSAFRMQRSDWTNVDSLKDGLRREAAELQAGFNKYFTAKISIQDIMDFLEFNDPTFYDAFCVPTSDDGMVAVGQKGKAVNRFYLLARWIQGKNAGQFLRHPRFAPSSIRNIWAMPHAARHVRLSSWQSSILREYVSNIAAHAVEFNSHVASIDAVFSQSDSATLRSKRIIGCTTTAAAKYNNILQAASPEVLLVEEAGEILESHVLTALGTSKDQLILIGDHKQLRPKVNDYKLTVEKGEGYDLNISLFERLVLKGYPHETLSKQHRMRPEISRLIRKLTYPDLADAPSTQNRPQTRGLQDNVIFISHEHPEDDLPAVMDRLATSSKQNTHEANLVLKIVRYLAQQGYGTDDMVILTPYLGQLSKLVSILRADTDPILNDLDSHDLVRAGLVSSASAKLTKKSIRLATIDNYQGEESEIVVASLTRSNSANDIGFMFAPERLNVLLSRARNTLILIGNAHTFKQSRKGGSTWTPLFEMLSESGHMYDGLPVQCQQHPKTRTVLINVEDFDKECPDGGCKEPCGVQLSCGIHACPSKCHQLHDHSKMKCLQLVYSKCSKGHEKRRKCHEADTSACFKCDQEARIAERKRRQDFELQQKREAEEMEHTRKVAEIENEIALERQKLRDGQLVKEREEAIRQKLKDLQDAVSLTQPTQLSPGLTTIFTPLTENIPDPGCLDGASLNLPLSSSAPVHPATSTLEPSTSSKQVLLQHVVSAAEEDWNRRKSLEGVRNDAIDAIMGMTGLEKVKEQVLKILDKIDTSVGQNASLKGELFNIVFQGNPGTGKTTVARHYGKFLSSVGVISGNTFVETTGSRLANEGVSGIKKQLEDLSKSGGGTLFIDEAYQLTSAHNFQGSQVLDFLLAEMINQSGVIVFIFAGYAKQMEKFFEHNPGLPSRVPYSIMFEDYSDEELLTMLASLISKTWSSQMQVTDGVLGLYSRIAVRRLGRGRNREGFGNVRDLHNFFARVRERQSARLRRERSAGVTPNKFLLHSEDMIGPDPSEVLKESKAWTKLQGLIGLDSVKTSIDSMFSLIKTNYDRELQEIKPVEMTLNRVFLGSPGTGKTTVAKLYGEILADMGLLSNGEVVMKNPSDFIGSALGQSETNTKGILAATVGKVLIIDEAYMLYGGAQAGGASGASDPYKTAVIDTIVAEVQNVPGDDRCVLLLGYKDEMVEMFQNVNQGLSRRFAIEDAFHFDDFDDAQLLQILNLKLKQQDLAATDAAKQVAIDLLSRARNRPNFGNAGEVENLLSQAKGRYQGRMKGQAAAASFDIVFESVDFDPDFDRQSRASANIQALFADIVGSEHIVTRLDGYHRIAQSAKARGLDPRNLIPTNFVFKGPPGTGKTTVARKMGQVFYDMGFLSSRDVIECSASDLVGQYVGQTGPKTKKVLEKALGRVLFVDEAYRLGEGHFAQEAMDELVGILTQERFMGKIVVVLAGYDEDMDRLMGVNSGLASRFPESIIFSNMSPLHCLELLVKDLSKVHISVRDLLEPSSPQFAQATGLIRMLSKMPSWGNARDIKTLAKKVTNTAYQSPAFASGSPAESFTLSAMDVVAALQTLFDERKRQHQNMNTSRSRQHPTHPLMQPDTLDQISPSPPVTTTDTRITHAEQIPQPTTKLPTPDTVMGETGEARDPGVSDAVWFSLQEAKQAKADMEKQLEQELRRLAGEQLEAERKERETQARIEKIKRMEAQERDAAKRREMQRMLEEARLRALAAKEEKELRARELEARRQEEQRRKQEEQKVQHKLREMGICPAGYRWVSQGDGYRCSAGGHYVSRAQLGL